jgi:hypothetical protein
MTVKELQELLKDKRPSMQVVIATYDENNIQKLFDLKGEDSFIRGGGPTFYFLEARKEAR